MNWQKGFNRTWLILSIALSMFLIQRYVEEELYWDYTFYSVLRYAQSFCFFIRHVVHFIILWIIYGFMDKPRPAYKPFEIK